MTGMIVATVGLAVINFLFKAAGPALLGDCSFPARTRAVAEALPVALLAALLAVDMLGPRWRDFDCTLLPGLVVAIALRSGRRPHLMCIAAAVACTAAVRALLYAVG